MYLCYYALCASVLAPLGRSRQRTTPRKHNATVDNTPIWSNAKVLSTRHNVATDNTLTQHTAQHIPPQHYGSPPMWVCDDLCVAGCSTRWGSWALSRPGLSKDSTTSDPCEFLFSSILFSINSIRGFLFSRFFVVFYPLFLYFSFTGFLEFTIHVLYFRIFPSSLTHT